MATTEELALLSLRVYSNFEAGAAARDPEFNRPKLDGWTQREWHADDGLGFCYGVYQKGSEIVVAYAGTNTSQWSDLYNDLAAGLGFSGPQVTQAAMAYLDARNRYGNNITLTGHSLGGGLASIVSAWFDRPATVFDEAPFQLTAVNPLVVDSTRAALRALGYSDLGAFETFAPFDISGREQNVANHYIVGEFLNLTRIDINTIIGSDDPISVNGGSLGMFDLHSQALLYATQLCPRFKDASFLSNEMLPRLMDSSLYAYSTTGDRENVLIKMIRSEQSSKGNGKLSHFAVDVERLMQGMTVTQIAQDAIISQALDWYYAKDAYAGEEFFAQNGQPGLLQYTTALGEGLPNAGNKSFAYTYPWIESLAAAHDDVYDTVVGDSFGKWSVVTSYSGVAASAQTPSQREVFVGLSGADTFSGSEAGDILFAGAGDDSLSGGGGADSILGGAGDDYIDGGAGIDQLQGGQGKDRYDFIGAFGSDTVRDSDRTGSVLIGGTVMTGGEREAGEDYYTNDSTGTQYRLFGNMLHIHRDGFDGSVHVDDWTNGDLGIRLREKGKDGGGRPGSPDPGIVSPIVLDLDGNGVTTLGAAAGVHFDHDGNGFAELTGWVGAGDGLLARDIDGNGTIDTGTELFGSESRLADGTKAENGFVAFAELDSNHDGAVNAGDGAFASLRVWIDRNADGRTDAGELLTLAEAGVASISVTHHALGFTDSQGNQHAQLGSYQATDGTTRAATDVWFTKDVIDSIATGPALQESAEIAALPDIEGYGTVRSLHQAMASDATLQSLISQFTQAQTDDDRARLARDIVWRWTAADTHTADSRGQYITDARWLYMVEAFTGKPFIQSAGTNAGTPNPGPNAAEDIYRVANQQYELMLAQLTAQTHLKGLFDQATVTWSDSERRFVVDLSHPIETLVAQTNTDRSAGLALIGEFTRTVQALGQMTPELVSQLDIGLAPLGAEALALVASPPHAAYGPEVTGLAWHNGLSGHDSLLGGDGSDTLVGAGGNDTLRGAGADDELVGGADDDMLDGGAGNDRLYGGDGADTYLFGRGAGQDTVLNSDYDGLNVRADKILVSVASTEVLAKRFGDDLVLTIIDSSDRMIVAGYFAEGATTGKAVESIAFADGVTWNIAAVKSLVLVTGLGSDVLLGTESADAVHALDGNDTIRAAGGADQLWGDSGDDDLSGEADNDTLDGGAGDDVLDGGAGDDTYLFGVGGGHDTVREGRDALAGGTDTVRIQGVAPGTVKVSRDRTDIIISLPGHMEGQNYVDDSIRLQGALDSEGNTTYRIEQLLFDDGTIWTLDDLKLALTTGTAAADVIEGYSTADVLDGGAGDDSLLGRGGSDTLLGHSGNDVLYGGDGDDRLEGGAGADQLDGGAGNNTFVFGRGDGQDAIAMRPGYVGAGVNTLLFKTGVAPDDVFIKQAANGAIEVLISGTDDSVKVENFFRWGTETSPLSPVQKIEFADGTTWDLAAIQARIFAGTPGDDTITGTVGTESIVGQGGNDYISGGGGADTVEGGSGNDTMYGWGGADTLRGGDGDDLLRGGAFMEGGAGDDLFEVSTGQVIVFGLGHGQDVVRGDGSSSLDSTIRFASGISAADITVTRIYREVLNQYGQVNNAGYYDLQLTIKSTGDSILIENFAPRAYYDAGGPESPKNPVRRVEFADGAAWDLAEICRQAGKGGEGNDTIIGFVGPETLEGGAGDDLVLGEVAYTSTFYVSDWEASPDLLLGQAGNDELHGGDLDTLDGGEGDDDLWGAADAMWGGAGNDRIDGRWGDVQMRGGTGSDLLLMGLRSTIYFDRGDGQDTILGGFTTVAEEKAMGAHLRLGAGISSTDVVASIQGNDDLVLQFGAGDQVTLGGYFAAQGQADNANVSVSTLDFADGSSRALDSWLQNGTASSEQITGTSGSDLMAGYAGNDTLNGSGGDDGLQGGYGNDSLTGGAGNDTLAGGGGTDKLVGGTGDDVYYVDYYDSPVLELAGEGTDTVYLMATDQTGNYVLAANVENLVLGENFDNDGYLSVWYDATGNSLNNRLTGNTSGNVLNGGAGIDTLVGGDGSDTYVVDSTTDTITENAGEGIDTLESSVTISALTANVENLTLSGSAAINGTGNALDNVLTGNTAANVLSGGLGNDTYVLDSTIDTVAENAGEGTDTIETSVSQASLAANVENLILAYGAGAISGNGNALDNTLTGNYDANTLEGGGGVDTLIGGYGDDTYVVDSITDSILEKADQGIDTLQSSVTVTSLASNVEDLVLTGSASIDGSGNELNNVLIGNSGANSLEGEEGADTLNGGDGADTLIGGAGDDTYVLDADADTIIENADEGIDTIQSHVTVTALAANVENLTLTGTAAINGTGNALANVITGNSAANTLTGGLGDDIYLLDSSADTVIEYAGEGTDTIQSSVTVVALTANVENVVLTGSDAINGTGNDQNNLMVGNVAANVLAGGAGDDTYVLDAGNDTVLENVDEGTDTIQSSVTVVALAANVENLVLTGTAAIDGTGNASNNVLRGNAAANRLAGGAGDDTYVLGSTADTVVENASEGTDTIQSSVTLTALAANVENLTLTGSATINGTGNAQNNVIIGNAASNTLDGAAGIDTLAGGAGNDVYVVDSATDTIIEDAGDGVDTVRSSVSLAALAANVENLTLTGSGSIDGGGNALNNVLSGNGGANTLDGGGGIDTLVGGSGDDVYVVDSSGDTITELANGGTDTIRSSVTIAMLAAEVENLTLTGTGGIDGSGNGLNNRLIGNAASNMLSGGVGSDTLDGGGGDDWLSGGIGDDTYVVDSLNDYVVENVGDGLDTVMSSITQRSLAGDVERLTLTGSDAIDGTGNSLNNVLTGNAAENRLDGGAGRDTLIGGAGDDTYVVDTTSDTITENANEGVDTVESCVDLPWLAANVENLTLTGTTAFHAYGNGLDNVLTGNVAANYFDGGGGIDTLVGGAGNDLYVVDSATDTIVEGADEGLDTVQSSATVTLAANVENLTLNGTLAINGTGNALDNLITGNSAANVMAGGLGDDTYVVASTTDTVVEDADEGIDTIQSSVTLTLAANVENLTLTGLSSINGTGNALDNLITGNSSSNVMTGGLGNDTYVMGSTGDSVVENAGEGTDTIRSSITLTALTANVENLELTGTAALNGTGNALDNVITGNLAANTLNGAAGIDTLAGGAGNDIYVVDSTTDTFVENAAEGVDTIQSSVTLTLASNVENLTLTGTSAINGTGNELDNLLTGNSAANVLTGGLGDDTYVVASTTDTVVENAGGGTDTVQTSVTLAALAANVENLTLTGASAINGTGNALNNLLTGNSGANTLNGGDGIDTLWGGAGNDIYIVDSTTDAVIEYAGGGTDTLQSSVTVTALVDNVENLTLTGTTAIDGTGNALNNVITGNSAANVMTGGLGDDTYVVGSTTDTVIENVDEGVDTIQSSVTVTALTVNVENLTLSGTSAINGTGNALDNVITGNSAANVMTGGLGNDTYVVGSTTDTVVENAGEGVDTVQSSVTLAALTANVENLTLIGASAINGTGNSLDNVIAGNAAANTLNGGAGIDTLAGGAGNDVYVVDSTTDTITEASGQGTDTVQSSVSLALAANVENLTLTGASAIDGTGNELNNVLTGNSAANTLAGGAGDDTYVLDSTADTVIEAVGEGVDTIQSSVTVSSLAANVENLTLTGTSAINGTGNALNNLITGNSAANVMSGGLGNDTYVVGSTTDTVIESADEGIDTIQSSVTLTLVANVENLTLTGASAINGTGNALNNVITGNSAANVMTGGLGDDTYVVASTTDSVVENADEGIDTVQSSVTLTLAANAENLTLTGASAINGTGNALDNVLTGNSGTNVLTGSAGNDTYVVQSTSDSVVENAGEGTDTIQTSVTLTSLAANVENLMLLGSAAINGTGNALDNLLAGNSAANTLNGGAGIDTLIGGGGNDIYVFDSATDSVIEYAGEGTDTVQSSVTIAALSANVENLTLTGATAIDGAGNDLDNTLTGNSAANTLSGGLGDDTYVLNSTADTVVEGEGEGTDTVQSSVTVTSLAANVENITLTGSSSLNATGNSLNNVIAGNSGYNVMTGGLGDDTYVVGTSGDSVIELAGEGADIIQTTATLTSLAANVENLQLIGTGTISGTGNELNNLLTGNVAANVLTGGDGDDTLDGAGGSDTLVGGAGGDTYRFGLGAGADRVQENDATAGALDWVEFGAQLNSNDVTVYQVGNDLQVTVNSSSDVLTIADWYLGSPHQVENFRWADGSVSTAAEMEARAVQTVQGAQGVQSLQGTRTTFTNTEDLWLNPMRSVRSGLRGLVLHRFLTPEWVRWHDVDRALTLSARLEPVDAIGIAAPTVHGMLLLSTEAGGHSMPSGEVVGGRRHWTDPERQRQTAGSVL